jgi:[ribosomal protein S18]-alanine N-acetyltransferase
MMATSEPWTTIGRTFDQCLTIIRDRSREVHVAYDTGRPVAFAILNMHGAFVGYIQIICVAAEARGRGVGTALMRHLEERIFGDVPNVFLCVSSFNLRAKQFYGTLGYRVVGEMLDYLVRGHSEILMRKTIAPIDEFRKRARS